MLDPPDTAPLSRQTRVLISASTVLAMILVVVIGVLHIFIWNPLARVPGLSLDEIYARVDPNRELLLDPFPWIWASFWILIAIGFAGIGASRSFASGFTLRGLLATSCTILSVAIFFSWFAGWSMGMQIADAFFVGGMDAASPGLLLTIIGQFLAVAALFLTIAPRRTNAGRLPEQTTRVVSH